MKQIKVLLITAALAALWFVGGYVVAAGFMLAAFGELTRVPLVCGAANLAVGLALLVFVTRHPRGWRLFYAGPLPNEDGSLAVAFLWGCPIVLAFVGLVWWLVRHLLRIAK